MEVYIVATESGEPVDVETIRSSFESDEAELVLGSAPGWSFSLKASDSEVHVRFEPRTKAVSGAPELLTGSPEAHGLLERAQGFYRIAFTPGKPQPSVAVFDALWCARAILERLPGVLVDVTAYKLHEASDVVEITELEFDIRDHVNLHAVEVGTGTTPLWVHSHGMEKFASRNVEVFHLAEQDLLAAESFLHELCTDLAFGQGPDVRSILETSAGETFMLVPSEEARPKLMGVSLETFEGHEGLFLTVTGGDGRHTSSELLKAYRDRFQDEPSEKTDYLLEQTNRLLPAFKARFHRRGLMEPLAFLVRATFETHPDGEASEEDLWLEVLSWEDNTLTGKLMDGSGHTTEWRKGAAVEVKDDEINAISLTRDGKPIDEPEIENLLVAERPM